MQRAGRAAVLHSPRLRGHTIARARPARFTSPDTHRGINYPSSRGRRGDLRGGSQGTHRVVHAVGTNLRFVCPGPRPSWHGPARAFTATLPGRVVDCGAFPRDPQDPSTRGSWIVDFPRDPQDPSTRGSWIVDFPQAPRDPTMRGSWIVDSLKRPNPSQGGGCYKVTFIVV